MRQSGHGAAAHRGRWASESLPFRAALIHNRYGSFRQVMCTRTLARRWHVDVHVGIETHGPPTRARLDVLRSAAARFTDNKARLHVTHAPMPDRHRLMTQFTRRTTAQYKVVDEIAAGFKGAIGDFADSM